VAGETLIGVEARTEAIVRAAGHDFDVSEARLAILEEGGFVRSKTAERTAGAWRASAHARIAWR
jgi:hypothetical protein